jgi:hypothetical protein
VRSVGWLSCARGFSQTWLQVREDIRKNLYACYVIVQILAISVFFFLQNMAIRDLFFPQNLFYRLQTTFLFCLPSDENSPQWEVPEVVIIP